MIETNLEKKPEDVKIKDEPTWGDALKSLFFIALTLGVAYYVTIYIGIEHMRESVVRAGIYAPFIIIILKATTIVIVPLGGTPLYPLAGALFGFWKGLFITLVGDALGSAIAFYLSKIFGRKILHFFMSREQMPIVDKLILRCSELKTFIKVRVFFTGLPDLFAYAAGFMTIPFPLFLLVHVGMHALPAALLVIFGDALVAGNTTAVVISGIITTGLTLGGMWWFNKDFMQDS